MDKETKHGIFNARIEEYYSQKNGIIYYHYRILVAGLNNKFINKKTSLKKLPEIKYEDYEKKEKYAGIIHAIDALEKELERLKK